MPALTGTAFIVTYICQELSLSLRKLRIAISGVLIYFHCRMLARIGLRPSIEVWGLRKRIKLSGKLLEKVVLVKVFSVMTS